MQDNKFQKADSITALSIVSTYINSKIETFYGMDSHPATFLDLNNNIFVIMFETDEHMCHCGLKLLKVKFLLSQHDEQETAKILFNHLVHQMEDECN